MKPDRITCTAKFIILCLAFVGSACAPALPATTSTPEITLPSATAADESARPATATAPVWYAREP